MPTSNRNNNAPKSGSVTGRLRNNLASYNPLSRKGRFKVSSKSPSQFARNNTNLRRNLLKSKKYNNKTKFQSLRSKYKEANRLAKLEAISSSYKNNLQKYIRYEDERRRKERAEALREAHEAPAYLSVLGSKIPIEPSEAQMTERLKAVDNYYPERQKTTYEQSKKRGPKGTKKEIKRIRRGLRATKNKEQKMYPYLGLPENINNYYYRANNVPQMVKNSHLASNRSIYGVEPTPSHYPKFRPVITPKKKPSRFKVSRVTYNE